MSGSETIYPEFDVKGDGNCFYRSLFNAARYHKDPTTLARLLGCFGLSIEGLEAQIPGFKEHLMAEKKERKTKVYAQAKNKYNKLVAAATVKGTKSRAKEPIMPVISPIDLDAEDIFTFAVRRVLVERIAGGIFEAMGEVQKAQVVSEAITPGAKAAQAAQPHSLPEIFHENAILGGDFYDYGLREASFQFQTAIRDVGGRAYFAGLPKDKAVAKFKEIFSGVIINDGVFASQSDIYIVKFILLGCGLHLEIPNPDNFDNPPAMPDKVMGMATLFVRNVNGNHYHFFAPEGSVPLDPEEGGQRYSTRLNRESALAELQRHVEAAAKLKANTEARARAKPVAKTATRKPANVAKRAATRKAATTAKSYGAPPKANSSNNENLKRGLAASLASVAPKSRPVLRSNTSNED